VRGHQFAFLMPIRWPLGDCQEVTAIKGLEIGSPKRYILRILCIWSVPDVWLGFKDELRSLGARSANGVWIGRM